MTTTQHTPGPWANHDGIIRDCSPEGWLVATCRFSPKDDANARLIAAAPDMLEALRAIATYMRGDLTTDDFKSLGLKRGDMTGNVRRIAENVLTRIDGEAAP